MSQGKEILFKCPFCKHHKHKLSINISSKKWHCWVCDAKGASILSLLYQLGKKPAAIAYKDAVFANDGTETDASFSLSLPDEYVSLCEHSFRPAWRYLQSRHVTTQQILQHKIGFAQSGKYAGRVILPSFSAQGTVNFFTGRSIDKNAFLRYLNPSTPSGYKNTIVLNELNISWDRSVVLVEGFFDMLRISNAIPLFGSIVSVNSKLFASLVAHSTPIYLCLDPDARVKQLRLAKTLMEFGAQVLYVNVAPHKDVAEMPTEAIENAFKCAKPMDRLSLMKERLRT